MTEPKPRLTLVLTQADRTPAPNPAPPVVPQPLPPPAATGDAERAYLLRFLMQPLAAYSLAQAAVIVQERARADAVVEKVDAFNEEADKLRD